MCAAKVVHLFRERWHIGVVVGVDFDGLALGAKSRDLRFQDLLFFILNGLGYYVAYPYLC